MLDVVLSVGPSARRIERGLQAAIGLMLAAGVVTANPGLAVNAAAGLGVTVLPAVLARDYRVYLGARLTAVITVAVFLHVAGMTGLYEVVAWWDHLTHTLSGILVAASGYAVVRALDEHSDALSLTPEFTFAFVLLFTMALGVVWEVLEFLARSLAGVVGVDPLLVQYGLADTLWDLVFDAVGAVLLAVFGAGKLQGLVRTLADRMDRTA